MLPRLDDRISLLVSAGLDTLAVRVPGHPVAQELLAETGVPVAAPSANMAGCISPTAAGHVVDRKSTRLNSSHVVISYAVFCLKKKKITPV